MNHKMKVGLANLSHSLCRAGSPNLGFLKKPTCFDMLRVHPPYVVIATVTECIIFKKQHNQGVSTNFWDSPRTLRKRLDIKTIFLTFNNPYFEGMVNQIYPPELQLNKANTSDTEASFLDLHLSISNGFVSSKIHDKRDDFDFDIYIST